MDYERLLGDVAADYGVGHPDVRSDGLVTLIAGRIGLEAELILAAAERSAESPRAWTTIQQFGVRQGGRRSWPRVVAVTGDAACGRNDPERPARPPASYNLNNVVDLGGANTVTAEQTRAAALVTCNNAVDADEARELLAVLGLVPDPRLTP